MNTIFNMKHVGVYLNDTHQFKINRRQFTKTIGETDRQTGKPNSQALFTTLPERLEKDNLFAYDYFKFGPTMLL